MFDFNYEYLGLMGTLLLAIAFYQKYKSDKEDKNSDKLVEKQEVKHWKITQWWLDSYVYIVFVKRAKKRQSTFLYLFFGFIAFVLFYTLFVGYYINSTLKFEELNVDRGIVKSINKGHKGPYVLKLIKEDGEIKTFFNHFRKATNEKLLKNKDIKVTIYSKHDWHLFWFRDYIVEIKKDGKFLRNYKSRHKQQKEFDKTQPFWIKFWFGILSFNIFMVWFLNRKELPIHRQNNKNKKEEK